MAAVYTWSHLHITAAYMAIPSVLLYAWLVERRRVEPKRLSATEKNYTRLVYGLFIGMCGVGHLEGLLAWYWPAYHVFAIWHLFTALVSWWAVAVTIRIRMTIIVGI